MSAGQYDILIEQGATFSMDLIVKSAPSTNNPDGVAVDLTGASIVGQIRPDPESPIVLATFIGTTIAPTVNGAVNLSIPAASTALIDAATYQDAVYDILVLFPNGMVRRLIQGSVTISPGVTR